MTSSFDFTSYQFERETRLVAPCYSPTFTSKSPMQSYCLSSKVIACLTKKKRYGNPFKSDQGRIILKLPQCFTFTLAVTKLFLAWRFLTRTHFQTNSKLNEKENYQLAVWSQFSLQRTFSTYILITLFYYVRSLLNLGLYFKLFMSIKMKFYTFKPTVFYPIKTVSRNIFAFYAYISEWMGSNRGRSIR